jgi:hypothetical protein
LIGVGFGNTILGTLLIINCVTRENKAEQYRGTKWYETRT